MELDSKPILPDSKAHKFNNYTILPSIYPSTHPVVNESLVRAEHWDKHSTWES